MARHKYVPSGDVPSANMKSLSFSIKQNEEAQLADRDTSHMEAEVDIDLREVYFLIMHFLSAGPCHRTYGQFWNELLEHQLLPRRYHAWHSRSGAHSGDENDDGSSFPLSYNKLVERYPHVEKDHLVKLLKQLLLRADVPLGGVVGGNTSNAAAVPTLLGTGSFSILGQAQTERNNEVNHPPGYMHWPHMLADQVHGLSLRELGGGFSRHHRAPSIRAACYAIAKPSTMVQKMQNIKKVRGHRNAVYCAIFDRSGRYVITGSDDRLVKIWSMETAYCLASCRGHEGDITDLAVTFNNSLVASASNDCIIRVWRLPDGLPISVLRGHIGAVTAIAFSPRPSSVYQLLSSSDDGTCRIWDARYSQFSPRIYMPKPPESVVGKNNGPSSSTGQRNHQIFSCAFNASGTVFVTGSSDTLARVWNACKSNSDDSEQPNHEMDILAGHENDVNYVQFSGCAVASRFSPSDASKEDSIPKFKSTWFNHDNIVTCSRDGSAIIWIPRTRRSHGKIGRWTRAYHLKVPPPPIPPQPPRGGPRQRILPTPRGVNMVVWSLDNRFVLAAIMDCRICVWNAVDGSLVHSLTGHNESTYVLDVHPFNPRIAMSAGYDGKTIVWDIWEGTPIRIYEIGRFRLVDGKFSPDGTSIILSDDVGQLYILNTGQGESQMDAKYDQFFLGDYRPLIQDTHGNVLDQETQLVPYRRNMQDLLCDSGMIPYPEPYQSMFQQRRLGALGFEWRPSSVRFAVGADISLDQDYHMLPIADLDIMIDPLPEFLDAMEWEPENEVQSDDNDSEYHITEDYSSGGERLSLSFNSCGDSECSADDSEVENAHKDGLRRSRRKKQKAEGEITTFSGRRVKRKNLDECDDHSYKNNRTRKSRNGRKTTKKSSSLQNLRPQRAAARNALHLFSRITGTSTDGEDEEESEGDSYESASTPQDSIIESEESDVSLQSEQCNDSNGKEILVDGSQSIIKLHQCPESHMNGGSRRRLVLKLPNRDSSKMAPPHNTMLERDSQHDPVCTSSTAPRESIEINGNCNQDPGRISGDVNGDELERSENGQSTKVEHHLDLLEGYKDGKISWGGVRTRTSKRLKVGEPFPSSAAGSSSCLDSRHVKIEKFVNGHSISEDGQVTVCPGSEIQYQGATMNSVVQLDQNHYRATTQENSDGARNNKKHSSFDDYKEYDKSPGLFNNLVDDRATSSGPVNDEQPDNIPDVKENPTPMPTKLRIRSKILSTDQERPTKIKIKSSVEDYRNRACDTSSEGPSSTNQNLTLNLSDHDDAKMPSSDHGDRESVIELDTRTGGPSRSVSQGTQNVHSHNRMFSAVYRRSKSFRARNIPEVGKGGGMEAGTSNLGDQCLDGGTDATNEGLHRTRSTEQRSSTRELNVVGCNPRLSEAHNGSEDTSSVEKTSINVCDEFTPEEWRSSSRITVGLRSTRNRRVSYHVRETSPPERRKSHQSAKSWLMLATHEEGSRYIPQRGDEVVYLRQGHQEYTSHSGSREVGPWKTIKGDIQAVECCRVEELEYSTRPGSGESCCKMTLQFVDPVSPVVGKSFRLTLPEVTGFPDFLVERTRYDAAIKRNWTYRDKCQVWWKNEGEEDGSWWEGRILTVKPKSPEFPDSPWERYVVQYKSDPTDTHQHSPWELYDTDTQWEQPHIDEEIRERLLHDFAKLEQSGNKVQDRYGVQKLKQVLQRSNFVNRFPVPLSLEVIQSRLENNYYRSLNAMKHDISVMLSNAETYFGRNAEILSKIRRLSDWFTRTLPSF